MKKILLIIGLTTYLAIHSNAASITQSVSSSVDGEGGFWQFNSFNQQLGTLTGVTLTIASSLDTGSFDLDPSPESAIVNNVTDYFTLNDLYQNSGLGTNTSPVNIVTTPGVPWGITGLQTFNIVSTSLLSSGPIVQQLDPQYYNLYQSSDGSDFVYFSGYNHRNADIDVPIFGFDDRNWSNTTTLNLTYNYTTSPVPEPSTYALFGLGALAMIVAYRRKVA
jgi:hypothetical protein